MFTYWTLEYYDVKNGIRGGGGLGVLAADTRRVAERMELPLVTLTPFYPYEMHQVMRDGRLIDEKAAVKYEDFGFSKIDYVFVRCNGELCKLDILAKTCGTTEIVAVTEPNFGVLYQGLSGSDHRLYQEVALGFGGYKALKLMGITPSTMQLNEVVTVFAALARLDDLMQGGMDFYTAMVEVRKRTIYTNHTLVQAAEAEFSLPQFEKYVFPNLESPRLIWWVKRMFEDGRVRLSSIALEIAGKRNCVSKLHARVAKYYDEAGEKVKFKAITNGIDLKKWVLPEILEYYQRIKIVDECLALRKKYLERVGNVTVEHVRELKKRGRAVLNETLKSRPDQNGRIVKFGDEDFVFVFKRRLVDYKRPELPFEEPEKLRAVLEGAGAHYVIAGRIHTGDTTMMQKLERILEIVNEDDYLREHVHYFADYDESLAYALSVGCNAAINLPVVGLEACGTSWMKDVANMNLLISTIDGGVADVSPDYCLSIKGDTREAERTQLYHAMELAIQAFENDFDLEYRISRQIEGYMAVISGERMMREYLDFATRV